MSKIIKISISVVLALSICVFSIIGVGAVIGSGLSLSADSKQVTGESTFDVTVSVTGNPGIVALRLSIEYDTTLLTLTNVSDAGLLGDVTLDNSYSSPYQVVWVNATAADNITATGKLLTLTFAAANVTEASKSSVKIGLVSANDCLDKDLNKVVLSVTGGEITIVPKTADIVKGDLDGNGIVDENDAIYVLYYVLHGETDYPLNQSVDFNGSKYVDADDAVYLLYYSLFGGEFYPLS